MEHKQKMAQVQQNGKQALYMQALGRTGGILAALSVRHFLRLWQS
jgi:hypothetical protein